jgi:type IV pilus assembly protein PilA
MRSQGFTLIQLMIVVITLGILIGLAIPFYELYHVRSQVSQGLALTRPVRLAINQYTKINRHLPSHRLAAQFIPQELPSNVTSINIDTDSIITVTYSADVGGDTLTLAPTVQGDQVIWSCTGGNMSRRYRPASCR